MKFYFRGFGKRNFISIFCRPTIKNDDENVLQAVSAQITEAKIEIEERRLKAASAWKNVMKAPPVAPLCKGHNETCLLRTVKKKGPNCGRQFWCCSKGEGRADDPNARCDFFKWRK